MNVPDGGSEVAIEDRERLAGACASFSGLSVEVRRDLCQAMSERRFEPGEALVIDGEPAGTMFLIAEGTATVSSLQPSGPTRTGSLAAGSVYGEGGLIGEGSGEKSTVAAASQVLALTLDRKTFASTVHQQPNTLQQVAAQVPGSRRGAWLHFNFLYRLHFQDTRRELLFLSSVSFFLTFISVRTLVHLIRENKGPFRNVSTKSGTHIHHLVWGILLLLLVGYLWLFQSDRAGKDEKMIRVNALLYGVGGALTLDEFALWLKLADVYFSPAGEESVRVVFAFGSVLSMGVWGGPFFRGLGHFLLHRLRRPS